jgi:hypothetical protein
MKDHDTDFRNLFRLTDFVNRLFLFAEYSCQPALAAQNTKEYFS